MTRIMFKSLKERQKEARDMIKRLKEDFKEAKKLVPEQNHSKMPPLISQQNETTDNNPTTKTISATETHKRRIIL